MTRDGYVPACGWGSWGVAAAALVGLVGLLALLWLLGQVASADACRQDVRCEEAR